jgi:hypothetical protein
VFFEQIKQTLQPAGFPGTPLPGDAFAGLNINLPAAAFSSGRRGWQTLPSPVT